MKKSLRGNLQAFLPRVHLLRCRNIKWAKGECVLNQIVFAAGVLLFPAVCTTLGAAGVFLLRRSAAPRTQRVLSGMAAGIMLAASVWSLLLPAIERTRELGVAAWVPPSAGLVLGAAGLLRLESMAGQLLQRGKSRMVLAVTLHNLPEGMVVGLAAALALSGEPDAVSGALALSLGIGLQNIPEGAAVSLPQRRQKNPARRAQCRRQPAAGAQRPHPPAGVRGRGGIRSGGAAGRVGGIRIGRVGAGGTALAHECGGRLHGVRDGAGDDPGGRGAGRTRRGGEHRAGVCPDDGTGRGTVKKSYRNKIQSAGHRTEMLATGTGSSCTAVNE